LAGTISGVKGKIALDYRYTAGVAGQRYLTELRKGKLVGTRCDACAITYLPPRIYCEKCLRRIDRWVEVKGPAKLYSYTVVRIKGRTDVIGLARFAGVEGGILGHLDSGSARLAIGARVKLRIADGEVELSLAGKKQG
jgi:uncharacterized OB-fold protein